VLKAKFGCGLDFLTICFFAGIPFLLFGPCVSKSLYETILFNMAELTTPALGAAAKVKFNAFQAASPEGLFLS
jgi:hypothetical protein